MSTSSKVSKESAATTTSNSASSTQHPLHSKCSTLYIAPVLIPDVRWGGYYGPKFYIQPSSSVNQEESRIEGVKFVDAIAEEITKSYSTYWNEQDAFLLWILKRNYHSDLCGTVTMKCAQDAIRTHHNSSWSTIKLKCISADTVEKMEEAGLVYKCIPDLTACPVYTQEASGQTDTPLPP